MRDASPRPCSPSGLVLLALTLIGALTACTQPAASHSAPRTKVRVALAPYLLQAPLMIAQADSMFAEEGLDVEFVQMTNAEGVPALLRGELDVLPSLGTPALFNSMARGIPIRAVADRGFFDADGCTFMGIVVPPGRAASTTRSPRRVKRISIQRTHAPLYVIEKSLASVGLSVDSLDASAVPPLPEAEALGKGTLDAAFVGEPWLTRDVVAHKAELWLRAERVLPNAQIGFIFFGSKLLVGNRDVGRRFVIAYRRAIARYLEGKTPANVDVIARVTGDTPELVRQSCWPSMRRNGRIDLASVLDFERWLQQKGVMPVPPTPAQLWDSSFVVYADSVLARRHQ